jgi:hypothetical protein
MADNEITRSDAGDVEKVNVDEVILPGDPRHGVHNPTGGPSDALDVHDAETPNEVSGDEAPQVDVPESKKQKDAKAAQVTEVSEDDVEVVAPETDGVIYVTVERNDDGSVKSVSNEPPSASSSSSSSE